ncbi:MAG: DnaJ family domain-containing protein [Verrucomicrobiota bacterium]
MWDRLAEQRIIEAIDSGDLVPGEGQGEPVDLDDYFSVPGPWRMAYSLLRNHGFVPAEAALRKELWEIGRLLETVERESESERWSALKQRRHLLDAQLGCLREQQIKNRKRW